MISSMMSKTLLEQIAYKQGITDVQVESSIGSEKGHGYIADINSARIQGKDKNSKDVTLNLILKTISTNVQLQEVVGLSQLFNREIFMYDKVFPVFFNFIKEKGLDLKISVPKCYEVATLHGEEVLIFEDLKDYNFEQWDRTVEMEDEHVRLILGEYGRFHALSFALQDQRPELYAKITEPLDNMYYKFLKKTGFFDSFVNAARKAEACLKSETDGDALVIYGRFSKDAEATFKGLLTASEEYQVILHGDCWFNNMMFQYQDPNNPKKPTALRLLDFQMSRIGSPVCDIIYFIYVCCSKTILDNLDLYMSVYYESLSNTLEKLGSNPEELYPFSVFKQHWAKYAGLGLVKAAFFKYILLTADDELVSFSEVIESGRSLTDGFEYEIRNVEKYYERIRNVILHCIKNKFIV